jgi:NADH dehydrogenase
MQRNLDMSKAKVVIVGGGYTSIWTRKFLKADAEVTVICDKSYHSFHGWTAEAITGVLPIESRQTALKNIFHKDRIIIGTVVGVNIEHQTVCAISAEKNIEIPYDHLVLANGSHDQSEIVPGLKEYGFSVKTPGAVKVTKAHLEEITQSTRAEASESNEGQRTIIIAGGGLSGIELAGNISELNADIRVILIHSGEQIGKELLPRFNQLAQYCKEQLEEKGVELILNTQISKVNPDGAWLSNGSFIPSKTIISTIGQKAQILAGTEALQRNDKNLIQTDSYLRVKNYPNIWTGGDTAQVIRKTGQGSPANALWAIMHGKWIGQNLTAILQKKKLKTFSYPGLGQAGSLGIGKGFAELYGIQFTGWTAWFLRFGFFLLFHPTRRGAIKVLLNWLDFALNGRKLEKFPIHEDNLQKMEYTPLIEEKY